jgi:hypothetical protein
MGQPPRAPPPHRLLHDNPDLMNLRPTNLLCHLVQHGPLHHAMDDVNAFAAADTPALFDDILSAFHANCYRLTQDLPAVPQQGAQRLLFAASSTLSPAFYPRRLGVAEAPNGAARPEGTSQAYAALRSAHHLLHVSLSTSRDFNNPDTLAAWIPETRLGMDNLRGAPFNEHTVVAILCVLKDAPLSLAVAAYEQWSNTEHHVLLRPLRLMLQGRATRIANGSDPVPDYVPPPWATPEDGRTQLLMETVLPALGPDPLGNTLVTALVTAIQPMHPNQILRYVLAPYTQQHPELQAPMRTALSVRSHRLARATYVANDRGPQAMLAEIDELQRWLEHTTPPWGAAINDTLAHFADEQEREQALYLFA